MANHLKLVRNAAVAAAGATLVLGEACERYDDANRVAYAVQNLHRHRRASRSSASDPQEEQKDAATATTSTAWLAKDAPKFPYLLGISPGDNLAKVVDAVLDGSQVIGSLNESTRATLRTLTAPFSFPELFVGAIALRWKAFKASLHTDLPAEFDPRVSALASTLDDVLEALKAQQGAKTSSHPALDTRKPNDEPTDQPAPPQEIDNEEPFLVFFLRDFDELSGKDAESWVHWVHEVTSLGLAHVVMPTRAGITPTSIDALQTLLGSDDGEFVAIVLRVAKGVADTTSAQEKLLELEEEHKLGLQVHEPELDGQGFPAASFKEDEAQLILQAVGNWWSDLVAVSERLKERDLAAITAHKERVELIRSVCEELRQDAMALILSQIHLDGSLDLSNVTSISRNQNNNNGSQLNAEEEKALRALEAWKCLEVVTGVAAKSGLMASPQQFLIKDKQKPVNCVHPVEALLPFGHRKEGEAKFLQLIDENILFLRPKADVEIGVVPCAASDLIAPCWIETRPLIVSAFKKIWRNDNYFSAVQDLERISTNKTLREEIDLYAQEIDERRQLLTDQKAEFILMQFKFTKAERATRVAEVGSSFQLYALANDDSDSLISRITICGVDLNGSAVATGARDPGEGRVPRKAALDAALVIEERCSFIRDRRDLTRTFFNRIDHQFPEF